MACPAGFPTRPCSAHPGPPLPHRKDLKEGREIYQTSLCDIYRDYKARYVAIKCGLEAWEREHAGWERSAKAAESEPQAAWFGIGIEEFRVT